MVIAIVFRFLTRCVIVGNLDAAIDDLCESAIIDYGDVERESEEIRRYLRQGECDIDCFSPDYLPHNDFVRFKVVELEEQEGCMCLKLYILLDSATFITCRVCNVYVVPIKYRNT